MVVWRPTNGRWYARREDGSRVFPPGSELQYGTDGDVPLVGDYDGDGVSEAVIWRPSNARWYARRASGSVVFSSVVWGLPY